MSLSQIQCVLVSLCHGTLNLSSYPSLKLNTSSYDSLKSNVSWHLSRIALSKIWERDAQIERDKDRLRGVCAKDTARSLEDETRNRERNANRNPEWWEDFSQLVNIEKIESFGISRYKVELRFWLALNSEVSRGTNSNPDFGWIWICSRLKSPHHSGFRFAFRQAFRVWATVTIHQVTQCLSPSHTVWLDHQSLYDLMTSLCVTCPSRLSR